MPDARTTNKTENTKYVHAVPCLVPGVGWLVYLRLLSPISKAIVSAKLDGQLLPACLPLFRPENIDFCHHTRCAQPPSPERTFSPLMFFAALMSDVCWSSPYLLISSRSEGATYVQANGGSGEDILLHSETFIVEKLSFFFVFASSCRWRNSNCVPRLQRSEKISFEIVLKDIHSRREGKNIPILISKQRVLEMKNFKMKNMFRRISGF